MTVEQMVAALAAEGWQVWSISRGVQGRWSCRLYEPTWGADIAGRRGRTSYDLECWRQGTGPTMLAALSAAAVGLPINSQLGQEEALDLAAMLS